MRLLSLDLETTSLDLQRARIVSVSLVQYVPDGDPITVFDALINPGCAIPPEATAIHGITNEDVADCPAFEGFAQEIQEALFSAVLAGFNIRRFDVPILDRELRDADQAGIDFDRVREIDCYRCWYQLEKRDLEHFVQRFAPDYTFTAHRSDEDARALLAGMVGMLEYFGLTLDNLEALTKPDDEVDRFGRFRREDGKIVFAFGKHKGKPAMEHQEYLTWMLRKDTGFHPQVKAIIKEMLYQQTSAL